VGRPTVNLATPFEAHEKAEKARTKAAKVDGRHYSTYVNEVRALRRAGDDDAAAGLLLRLVAAIEREARHPLAGCIQVPRWYFNQLAAIYRKSGDEAARGRLMQKYALLQAGAERSGHQLLEEMRSASAEKPSR
jgi:hypothetical protein